MRRRTVLGACVAAATAGCVDAAPPSGPRNPPTEADARAPDPTAPSDPDDGPPAFRIGAWDLLEDDDGRLLVTATVINDAPSERSGRLVVTVTLDDETVEADRELSVPAGEELPVELVVDVPFDRFDTAGSLTLDLDRAG